MKRLTKRLQLPRRARLYFGISASATLLFALLGATLTLVRSSQSALAASESSCINDSGASSVESVQHACWSCFNSSSVAHGALWINNSSSMNSDTVTVSADQAASGSVPIRIWGRVYSCSQGNTSSNYAYHIWFGEDDNPNSAAVDFISLSSNSLYRGTGTGYNYTWHNTGGSNYLTATLNIAKFRQGASCSDLGNGTAECSRTVSVNRCFRNVASYASGYNSDTCYGDPSTIKLIIPNETVVEDAGEGDFWTTSTVSVNATGDISRHSETSNSNSTVRMKFSTNQSRVTVNFSHNIYYGSELYTYDSGDIFPNLSTTWKVTNSGARTGQVATGTLYTNKSSANSGSTVGSNSVTLDISAGETVTLCQTNKINPSDVSLTRTEHTVWDNWLGKYVHDYWEYSATTSGTASSKACVEITRPELPDGEVYNNTSAGVVYAGEEKTIGWDVSTYSYPTRRLVEYQVAVFQNSADVAYTSTRTTGSTSTTYNPCNHYYYSRGNNFSGSNYCSIIASGSVSASSTSTQTYSHYPSRTNPANMVMPNEVGSKYCNTFGYKFKYYYGVQHGSDATTWTDENKDYWHVYDAVCRTVAKKPSVAIWNGSLYTQGGIKTTLSDRYDSVSLGATASGSHSLYGSWSEYLVIAGRQVNSLASGASLARGSVETQLLENSPLTIANRSALNANNVNNLGYAEIPNNTAFYTRLETYLKSGARPLGATTGYSMRGISETQIYHRAGDLEINDNITLADSSHSDLASIPRVIIFVDGDVDIRSHVTRIDAWIIATGTIDTCSDFRSGSTVSDIPSAWASTCTQQLVFNGPVVANNLVLNRSYGSDPLLGRTDYYGLASTKSSPAEIFNYRADDYLWGYAQSTRYSSSWSEAYTRELPPRY